MRLPLLILLIAAVAGAQSAPPRKDIPAIAKAANGAIVTIITAVNDKPVAQGTGFLVSADGVILTNYHVIESGNVAIVKFPDDTVFPVDGVLAADKVRDLAVIKIHGKAFRMLTLGNSDLIRVGEEVVAIGNPLGLELTVSNGILSGIRTSKQQGGKFLQTTAPISPGSSGGPLFNMEGKVVGITTLYLKGGENLNFAIPINDVKLLLQKQPTNLLSLPNEADTETSKPNAEVLSQEQACKEQAAKFEHYNRAKGGDITEFVSHFSIDSRQCFIEIGFYEMVHQESFAYQKANGQLDTQLKEVNPYPVWTIKIYDASSEGDDPPIYGSYYQRENHIDCRISEIRCRSKEEFDDLASKHFGIAHLTKIVPMIP